MVHHKLNLPSKTCPVCSRPFNWRKKWQDNWAQIKYCSKRCANQGTTNKGTTNNAD